MNKGRLNKTLKTGGRVLIGEGSSQIEVILAKSDNHKAKLIIIADRNIPIHHLNQEAEHCNG